MGFFYRKNKFLALVILITVFTFISSGTLFAGEFPNNTPKPQINYSRGNFFSIENSIPPSFVEGKERQFIIEASFRTGQRTATCTSNQFSGLGPKQSPLVLDQNSVELMTNFGKDRNLNLNKEFFFNKIGQESPWCADVPVYIDQEYNIRNISIDGIDRLPPGDYWAQLSFSTESQIADGSEARAFNIKSPRFNFTVLPKQLKIDLSPSLSVQPREIFNGERVNIDYTVSNSKEDIAENVIVEIHDNGNRIYRTNLGNINGGGSVSNSITRRLDGVGNHNISIVVDPGNKIEETNESNNSRNRDVTVQNPPRPSVSLSADPSSVSYQGSSVLRWRVSNATSCNASGDWSGSKSPNDSSEGTGSLTNNKSYTLNCSGPGGSDSDSTSVSVSSAPPAPSVSLSANPQTVSYGNSSTLNWTVRDATSCSASGDWSGSKSPSGGPEGTGNLTSSKSYTLSCSGQGGSGSATASVGVASQPPSIGTISVRANLNGNPWSGSLNYNLNGPSSFGGSSVSQNFNNQSTGTWNLSYSSGGPSNATLNNISLSNSQTLTTGGTIVFTLNFSSNASSNNPNLTLSKPQASGTINSGDSVVFTTNISNNGGASAGPSFRTTFEIDGVPFSNKNESTLGQGSSVQSSSSSWSASGVGLHQVRVCTDTQNVITESNESDNCATNVIEVVDPNYSYGQGYYQGSYSGGGNGGGNSGGGGNGSGGNGGGSTGGGGTGGGAQINPECSDGIDNDGDGWVDLDDPGCTDGAGGGDALNNGEIGGDSSTQCSDGVDNDGDTFIDGNDPECSSPQDNTEKVISFDEF